MNGKRNNILKRKRELALMSQTDVSIILEISFSSYSQKELGKRDFTQSEMKTLAQKFNCTLDELFGEEKDNAEI